MKELPGEHADLTSADSALAGTTELGQMTARLKPVHAGRDAQAERVGVAASNVEEARAALAQAEAVLQREAGDLVALDRAIATHEAAISEVRDRQRRDKERNARVTGQAAQARRRAIEDGLIAMGQQA